jgi:Flp pilus assembly protein TadG
MGTLRRLAHSISQFRAAQTGVAAVEFALILPIMLLVYVGMVEASALISVDRKVQSVSGAVGDLVARSEEQITAAELLDYVRAARGIMTPYPTDDLVQIVTQVYVEPDGDTRVDWSKRYLDGVLQASGAHVKDDEYRLPDDIITLARDEYVIVAESSTLYRPLYGIVFEQPITLYRENFYLPRFDDRIVFVP